MAKNKKPQMGDREDREAGRKDTGAGNEGPGAVDGLGGAGGSSGTGSVRATPRTVGELSGVAEHQGADAPVPGTRGRGVGRKGQQSDGGLSGRTRGPDAETVPNQENPGQSDSR